MEGVINITHTKGGKRRPVYLVAKIRKPINHPTPAKNCMSSQYIFALKGPDANSNRKPNVHTAWLSAVYANAPAPGTSRRLNARKPVAADITTETK
jgi:hypothetical protein